MLQRPFQHRVLTASLLVALALGTSCSGDEEAPEKPRETPEQRIAEVALDARPGLVIGGLDRSRRASVTARVGAVVDRWFEAAYLGGDYPRAGFGNAFPGFTRGAARQARRDRSLMSNATIGARVEEVIAERKVVRVDVLSPRRRAAAATARIRLQFRTEGRVAKRYVVTGRLMLTKNRAGHWRVFAYDVRRSDRPLGGGQR